MLIVTLTGNLGRDAVMRDAGQTSVCSFSVASTAKAKGEKVTTWVDCSIWGKRGESLHQYLTKGTKVGIVGELSTREHEGRTYLQCRVDQVDLMGGGERGGGRDSGGGGRAATGGGGYDGPEYQDSDDDSDIPF